MIRDEDRPTVRTISLQKWTGQFWSGQWEHQMFLPLPTGRPAKPGASEGEEVEEEEETADASAKDKKKT